MSYYVLCISCYIYIREKPSDYERGQMSLHGTHSLGAQRVVYKLLDTFKRGVFLFVENNTYHEDGGRWQGGLLFMELTR